MLYVSKINFSFKEDDNHSIRRKKFETHQVKRNQVRTWSTNREGNLIIKRINVNAWRIKDEVKTLIIKSTW